MKVRKAVIPAAGLGTRLLPSTKAMPKEMLPIIDKPTIQYIIEEAVESGIKDIIIVTGKGKKAIEDHFDTSMLLEETLKNKGKITILNEMQSISQLANIHYIRQGVPKGLGHAIWCARNFIGNEPFAVLLGDTLIKEKKPCLKEMIRLFEECHSSIIGVKRVNELDVSKYGIVDVTKGNGPLFNIQNLVEKPKIEDAPSDLAIFGRYILTPKIFDLLAVQERGVGNEIQLTDALQTMLKYENVYAQIFEGKSYDIGEKLGYLKTIIEFAVEREDLKEDLVQFMKNIVSKTD
ncbi:MULTISPECIES: UTP--glucose-1-phosphate uridylyltransferase GalU [Priestia]|uniref:UTP--glucose-1-phosphate uridylyltransferase GalU n=1 Tax=Priestia TaxID=2800373 RepID=UPI001C8E02DE|nr:MULTISPECIES: UTP--glucose-1-phosphate uridylyltransferase GalU [Priestia]MBY0001881.1 UTP--glucose-1-phosphate uridylyltransferase GalU [Priestia aryabhattai]MCZ8497457.1 UTP--glucose-1-phosphate uridylyltransferase GalU [Priestia megaterium]UYV55699.1 UTP--glucose-1-phosphate uridylyltransferase GalU [Priestia megaterium]